MKQFVNLLDLPSMEETLNLASKFKKNPFSEKEIGKHKTLLLLFFNASLRTRLSTEKAARNLGMEVVTLNVNDAWQLEFEEGAKMNLDTAEHVKEAAAVLSQFGDILAIRAFPSLTDKEKDASEFILTSFRKYASIPIVNMESATLHPLQGLTDAFTINELKLKQRPKVVLSWAPHTRALPHAVANSFVETMQQQEVDLVITHPKGYELNPAIVKDTKVVYDQELACKDADFIYVKNWSSYQDYGKVLNTDPNWMMDLDKLGNAKFMHCLPVRRNLVVADEVLDSDQSVVTQQAGNRTYIAQSVLYQLLKNILL
ncbi:MAG TPA: hypothetical protein VK050_01075 [Flavobacteriaceae bacterium]|nr:hypothetical protein [Flavobacteriaceae bacterium]